MVGIVLLGVFILLLAFGAPIAVCLGMSSVAAILVQGAGKPLVAVMSVLPRICSASSSKFVLLAIPFFIISGNVMEKAGISGRLINLAEKCLGHNLIVFVDFNNLQIDGTCDQVMPNGDLGEKFKSFGWEVLEIDGHDMEEICATLDKCYASKNGKPKCIYAHTIKGKGVSYMENSCSWHGTAPNKEERDQAFEELNAQLIP